METVRDIGTEYTVRSCACSAKCATKDVDIKSDGDIERKDGNKDIEKFHRITKEDVFGESLLVKGLLFINSRSK
jgi:hypothetical protein